MVIKNEEIICYLIEGTNPDLIEGEHLCVDCYDREPEKPSFLITKDCIKNGETLVCDRCLRVVLQKNLKDLWKIKSSFPDKDDATAVMK